MDQPKISHDIDTDRIAEKLREAAQAAENGIVDKFFHSESVNTDDYVTETIAIKYTPIVEENK